VVVAVTEVDGQENVEADDEAVEELLVGVVLVVGRLEEVVVPVVDDAKLEVGVDVVDEAAVVELDKELVVEEVEPLDKAKYAAAPAAAITITTTIARTAVAIPLEEACN
jgi:hypothetical protein